MEDKRWRDAVPVLFLSQTQQQLEIQEMLQSVSVFNNTWSPFNCFMAPYHSCLPIYSIETCMHIIRSITNQTNLVSKIHFERDRISFFKQHVARLPLPPLKVNVQMYEYQRKIAPTIREKLCKQTLIMHILTYNIHQNTQDSPISCSL